MRLDFYEEAVRRRSDEDGIALYSGSHFRKPPEVNIEIADDGNYNYKGEKMNKQQYDKKQESIAKTAAREQIKEVEKELQRLKAIIEAPERGRFVPKHGEDYWIVSPYSRVEYTRNSCSNSDRLAYSLGNCYRTREEAEKARDKQLALVKLRDLADELNGEFGAYQYYLFEREGNVKIGNDIISNTNQGAIYFTSYDSAETAISRLTQEEINLIFDLNN